MTPIPENALPNYDKRTIEDPSAFFRTLFHLRDIKEERAIPAIVKDYDTKTGEVTVLPMAKYTFDTRDGEAEVDRETVKVRALRICQGGYSISLPIFKGDTGWLIAGDRRCGAAIEKNGEIVIRDLTDEELEDKTAKPDDCSILNFENGFFVPFSWSVESIGDEKSLIIRNVSKDEELNLANNHGVYGTYPWSMIEVRRDGMVNAYGQGRKFTVRKEGLYLDDKPLKFLDDLILKGGEGIEIEKTILDDGKIQYSIFNRGVIAIEQGDGIIITPVEGKKGVFRIDVDGGKIKGKLIDHTVVLASADPGGQNVIKFFYTDGTYDVYSIANGLDGRQGPPGRDGNTPEITAERQGNNVYIYADGNLIATIEDGRTPQITASRTATKQTTIYADGIPIAVINDGEDGQGGGGGALTEIDAITDISFELKSDTGGKQKLVANVTKKRIKAELVDGALNPEEVTVASGIENVEVVVKETYNASDHANSFYAEKKLVTVLGSANGTGTTVFTTTPLSGESSQ